MTPAGFEPAIPTNERPQTHALDFSKHTMVQKKKSAGS